MLKPQKPSPAPNVEALTKKSRFQSCLLGLAVGDAVGTTLEFKSPGSFKPITDMSGGGPFALKPGQWTDDTSMALCLASSLVECMEMNAQDQMERYCRWWSEGYLSSTGRCFDIGIAVSGSLRRFQTSGNPLAGSIDPNTAGNGSLMRLAPVPMFFAAKPDLAIEQAGESSKTTHGTAMAVDACRYYAGLLVSALHGTPKDELLAPKHRPGGVWAPEDLHPRIREIAEGSFKRKSPPEIRGTGFVVQSLEAALWAFSTTDNFRACILAAANLGDDADTTAAIAGQLAGAFYSEEGIPSDWLAKIHDRSVIEGLATALYECSERRAA